MSTLLRAVRWFVDALALAVLDVIAPVRSEPRRSDAEADVLRAIARIRGDVAVSEIDWCATWRHCVSC